MTSFLKDGWKLSYWFEIVKIKIPRHLKKIRKRIKKGKSIKKVIEKEVEEEYEEGPLEWG